MMPSMSGGIERGIAQQVEQQNAPLIGGLFANGAQPAVIRQHAVLENADGDVGVSGVEGKQHICSNLSLHVGRDGDSEDGERAFQLRREKIRHPEQEDFALGIGFGKHRVLMIEDIERLRQLEGVFRHVRRFAGGDGALDG